jgi:DegV family protein with EDD domain
MTERVAIVTDTTACIPPEQVDALSIEVVPIQLIIDGKAYRDGIDITPSQFYELLAKAKKVPTTAGSLPEPYLEAYEKAARRAPSILCLTEPSRLSGMYNSALLAARLAGESLPGVTIEVLECSSAAAGLGLTVLAAARQAEAGKGLAEVASMTRELMRRVYLFATLDTLYYLVKGGRVPRVAGLANSVLHLKPVFSVNGGDAHNVALPRTTEGAMKKILEIMEKKIPRGRPVHVAVMHAAAPERAQELKDLIAKSFNTVELFITEFTPVMGVHTGPGLVGAAFYAEEPPSGQNSANSL